jgi:hypothetical protein
MRRWAAGAVALVLALVVSGCAGDQPEAPGPTPTPTALFRSDEEALAAATNAYAAYQEVADDVASDGGSEPDRFEAVAEGDALENGRRGAQQFAEARVHATGRTAIAFVDLVHVPRTVNETLVARVCLDVSAVDVVDETGKSTVSPSRVDRTLTEATFETRPNGWVVTATSFVGQEC